MAFSLYKKLIFLDENKVFFADSVNKLNNKYSSQSRTFAVTEEAIYNIGGFLISKVHRFESR